MDNFSGVHLLHFFLILLRNFDSILRPFFPVLNSIAIRAVPPLHFLQRLQTIKQHHGPFQTVPAPDKSTHSNLLAFSLSLYSRLLPCTSSIFTVFNTHGFQYSRFPPVFPTSSNLFRLHQHQTNQLAQICLHSSTHGSSLHKFDIHGFQYSRFLLYFQRLQTLKQHHALSDCISTRQIIKFAFFYPRLLHCTSSISTVSPPASQNISNTSINSTALFSDCATD
jgi:hypothetical protein